MWWFQSVFVFWIFAGGKCDWALPGEPLDCFRALAQVRLNQSLLYAHSYLVKSGARRALSAALEVGRWGRWGYVLLVFCLEFGSLRLCCPACFVAGRTSLISWLWRGKLGLSSLRSPSVALIGGLRLKAVGQTACPPASAAKRVCFLCLCCLARLVRANPVGRAKGFRRFCACYVPCRMLLYSPA